MSEPIETSEPTVECQSVFDRLAGAVDGSIELSAVEQAHVESCLRCQAELVRYRRLLRTLHDLRSQVIQPAPGLLADILDNIGSRAERQAIRALVRHRRVAYTGGIAVAAVAGVTGAVLFASRNRRQGKKAA